jgi:hypothetical protein
MESMAVMTVATSGPKRRTDAKTKASETEMRARTPGIRTVKDPVRSVNAARKAQSPQTPLAKTFFTDNTAIADPAKITAPR